MKLRSGKIYKPQFHNPYENDIKKYEEKLDYNFNLWKKEINNKIIQKYNMSCDDIPDLPYFDYFVEGVQVKFIFFL